MCVILGNKIILCNKQCESSLSLEDFSLSRQSEYWLVLIYIGAVFVLRVDPNFLGAVVGFFAGIIIFKNLDALNFIEYI